MLSEAGSTSSRSKGIVARMKPRHEDGRVPLQPGVSEATEIVITDDFQINPAKPTPVVPGGLEIPKTTAYAGIESVAIRNKRPASRTRIKSESKRIKAEGEIKETESQARECPSDRRAMATQVDFVPVQSAAKDENGAAQRLPSSNPSTRTLRPRYRPMVAAETTVRA